MMEVACFCGLVFSFSGSLGVCPRCGEYVTAGHVTSEEERQTQRELDAVLRSRDGLAVPQAAASE
jgi:hypothetical protein